MIRATATGVDVSANGAVVYLDNWAFIELAKRDPARRQRFLDALRSGIDLLFSVTNAAELSGPQGKSAEAVRAFLDEIGPRWFPARLDATEVVKRELNGESSESACIDESFFRSYVADQMREQASGGKIAYVSESFFRLGSLLNRLSSQTESIAKGAADFDATLREKMIKAHTRCKQDPTLLDRQFPLNPFDPSRRAFFVYTNLLRGMVVRAHSLKKGDGMDFCHAVIASAFSSFAALDTDWKRRIVALPPNPLARIYSPPELDKLVADMESYSLHQATNGQ